MVYLVELFCFNKFLILNDFFSEATFLFGRLLNKKWIMKALK